MRPRRPSASPICSPRPPSWRLLALSAAGCKTTGDDITGSIGASPSAPRTDADWRACARRLGPALPGQSGRRRGRHRLCPGAARHRAARPGGRRAGAGLDAQSARHEAARRLWPRAGRCRRIRRGARRARAAPTRPTIRTGASSTRKARCSTRWAATREAQRHYSAALKIVPNEPSVLSNLGLSYALEKHLKRAEATLRKAVAQPNAEPEGAAESGAGGRPGRPLRRGRDASPAPTCRADEAAANVAYLRQMLAQQKRLEEARPAALRAGARRRHLTIADA